MLRNRSVYAALFAGALLSIASAAQSAVVISPVEGGPFSLANATGTIRAFRASTLNTYYFPFTVLGGTDLLSQMQASLRGPSQQNVQFSLWQGSCGVVCSGALVGQSALAIGPALDETVGVGDYFLKLDSFGTDGALVSGALTLAAAPEPSAWALMILGIAALGSVLRRNGRGRPSLRAA